MDSDDLEEMDLQWLLAMVSRRVKMFMNQTGRRILGGSVGFDKSKARCYNCQGFGHFARKCQRPRGDHRQSSGRPNSGNQSSVSGLLSNAVVVKQMDGTYDWGVLAEELDKSARAFMAEVEESMEVDSLKDKERKEEEETASSDSELLVLESTDNLSTADFAASMANLETDKQKVILDFISFKNVCSLCTKLKDKLNLVLESHSSMSAQVQSLKEENARLRGVNTELKEKLKSDTQDRTTLKDIKSRITFCLSVSKLAIFAANSSVLSLSVDSSTNNSESNPVVSFSSFLSSSFRLSATTPSSTLAINALAD